MHFKYIIRAALIVALGHFCLFGSTYANAEAYSRYSVTGTAGVGSLESQGHAALQQLYGLKLGYNLSEDGATDGTGIEAVYNYLHGTDGGDAFVIRMDYLFRFTRKERLVPYVALGAGGISAHGDTGLVLALGGGAEYFLDDRLALRGDLRDSLVSRRGAGIGNVELTVGISYLFGRRAEPMPGSGVAPGRTPPAVEPPAALPEPVPGKAGAPDPAETDELDERPPLPPVVPEKAGPAASSPSLSEPAPPAVQPGQHIEEPAKPATGPEPSSSPAARQAATPARASEPPATSAAVAPVAAFPTSAPAEASAAPQDRPAPENGIPEASACSDAESVDCGRLAAGSEVATPDHEPGGAAPTPFTKTEQDEPSLCVVQNVKTAVTIHFGSGQSGVPAATRRQLRQIASMVNSDPGLRVVIAGHSDDLGSARQNYLLSRKRAQSVKAYLVRALKVDRRRVSAKGYGFYQPLSNKKTDGERKRRRRAVVIVSVTQEKR